MRLAKGTLIMPGQMHVALALVAVLAVTLGTIVGVATADRALTAISLTMALGGGVGWMMAGRLERQ